MTNADKKDIVLTCDMCRAVGSFPHIGWFKVIKPMASLNVTHGRLPKQWDVCSVTCLRALTAKLFEKR